MKPRVNLLVAVLLQFSSYSFGQVLDPTDCSVSLSGDIMAAKDVSAVAVVGAGFIVIGADEGVGNDENENRIQVLKSKDEGYLVHDDILLFTGNKKDGKEMDIEGIAVDGTTIYVVGSHSSKRSKVKASRSYKKNRAKFRADKVDDERNRDWVYRVVLDELGKEKAKEQITLRGIIADDPVLKAFKDIPSKENGIDIEGLAVKDGLLYAGFRGPVFREGYVPILKFNFSDPKGTNELLYVRLGGRGIRDMTSVSDGFLIIAGPVGDGPASYQLHHWDGQDQILGEGRAENTIGTVQLLGEIRPPEKGKAEGLAVLREDDDGYDLLVVYDGVEQRQNLMQRFRVSKPQ